MEVLRRWVLDSVGPVTVEVEARKDCIRVSFEDERDTESVCLVAASGDDADTLAAVLRDLSRMVRSHAWRMFKEAE